MTRRLGHAERRDEGLVALELAILFPVIIVMLLLVVGFGRVTHGRQLVDQAAAAGARAASLTNAPGQARADALEAARSTLTEAGLSCRQLDVDVDTGAFFAGGEVAVSVSCKADLSGMALAGLPGSVTLTSQVRAPLGTYRDRGVGFGITDAPNTTNSGVGP